MRRHAACIVLGLSALVAIGAAPPADLQRDLSARWQARVEAMARRLEAGGAPCAATSATGSGSHRWEARFGVLAHNYGALTERHESGYDVNAELLAPGPGFLSWVGGPRPHLGVSVASDGISLAYTGLTWDLTLAGPVFASFSLGGAVHDGNPLDGRSLPASERDEHPFLGCRALFRGALGLGLRLNEFVSLELFTDHASNAGLCSANAGIESTGLRFDLRL